MKNVARVVAALALGLVVACGSSKNGPGDGGSGGDNEDAAPGGSSGSSSGGASSGSPGTSSGASSSGSQGTSSSSSSGGASGSGSSGGEAGATAYDYSVYQHHKNPTRNGLYIESTFSKSAVSTLHAATYMGTVTTSVYAQPLYVENGPGGVPVFVVATEQNHLTVFNATNGDVVWDDGPSLLGQPVTGGLACAGNINPLGITGTPYIDTSSGEAIVYFDAMTTPDGNTTIKHLVYAVKLADGTVLPNWPVDLNSKVSSFTSKSQNQRGALQLLNGVLYVPYGGLWGDCGTYYGWVVGIPVATPQSPSAWHTTAVMSGIWGSGSLPTDGTSVFAVTGNSSSTTATSAWANSEAVIRLGAGPTFSGNATDYYTPAAWRSLDMYGADLDLGGANSVLVDLPGASTPHLLVQGGKDKNLYVLNRDNLGGVGTELVKEAVATGELKGAPVAYTTSMGTYVVFYTTGAGVGCPNTGGTGNLVAIKLTAGSPIKATVAWCAPKGGLMSPMVTTTDGTSNAIVWAATDSPTNNALWGFDGDLGTVVAGGTGTAMSSGIGNFNAPIAAHGRIAVAVSGQLYIFTL